MRTKREQVQAHRFVIRRIVSGMIQGNPEALEFPMRRTAGSVLGGLAIAVLVFGGFWLVGALFGSADWREQEQGAIIIDEQSAAVYVYAGKVLHPVENITSARLFLDDAEKTDPILVSTADLLEVERGDPFGIPGAPKVPAPVDSLVGLPWQVCSAPNAENDKDRDSHVTLSAPEADDRLGKRGVLVVSDGDHYLIWNNLSFPVPDTDDQLALGLDPQKAVEVHGVFVDSLEPGPELARPEIDKAGKRNEIPGNDEAENGQFFTAGGTAYVLTPGGFAEVNELTRLLLNGGNEPGLTEVSADTIREVGKTEVQAESWPDSIKELNESSLPDGAVVCAVHDSAKDNDVAVAAYSGSKVPKAIDEPTTTTDAKDSETSVADHVWTPPGAGALVRARGSDEALDGTVYLVMDGRRFALAGDAAKRLGYGDVTPTPVPRTLVELIPEGPTLDPVEVRSQYAGKPS